MWPLERSVHVTSDFHREWAVVAMQTMASTDETFLPWGSPYHSSHWIGRSTSGLRPYCCHWRGTAVRAFSLSMLVNSFWINEWRKNSQNKSRKWLMTRQLKVHDSTKLVYYTLGGARSGSLQLFNITGNSYHQFQGFIWQGGHLHSLNTCCHPYTGPCSTMLVLYLLCWPLLIYYTDASVAVEDSRV